MSLNSERLKELLRKRMNDNLSNAEQQELDDFLDDYPKEELCEVLEEVFVDVTDVDASYYNHNWEVIRQKIVSLPPAVNQRRSSSFFSSTFVRYAAAVLLVAIAGGFAVWWEISRFARNDGAGKLTGSGSVQIQTDNQDIACGLIEPTQKDLAKDNRIIHLSIHNGVQTLSISPGWQFHTTLPDGSKVVLNAASSVTYPGSFNGAAKREIEVKGEVFFDVVHKADQPFFVKVRGVELQALGTSFNVNAYGDKDSVYTTLVSGSLKAVKGGSSALLQPGQQAAIALKNTSSIQVGKANLAATGMWREGYFSFSDSRVEEVMRELGRWYKWDISYSSSSKSSSFSGTFCRRTSEADVLETLKAGGIHFQKSGNHITIE